MKTTIREELNDLPEEPYPEPLWEAKVEEVWQFVFGQYGKGSGSEAHPR